MEGALMAFSGKTDLDIRQELSTWTRTDTIPFDATHRFMATLNHDHERHAFVFVKGAPERILAMCTDQPSATGGTEPLNDASWRAKADAIATLVQRVLAFAVRPVTPEHTVLEHANVEGSLTLLGMVGDD
jgi:magnesium-transporting ATPase (P-type)